MAQSQVQATSLQESFLKLALLIAATPEIEAGRAYPGNPTLQRHGLETAVRGVRNGKSCGGLRALGW